MRAFEPVLHPARTIAAVARRPSLGRAAATVTIAGAISGGINASSALREPSDLRAAGIALAVAITPVLIGFWMLSAVLMDGAATRLTGRARNRRSLLATSALGYPVLALYGLIGLAQTAAGPGIGDVVSEAAGLSTVPLLAAFVALTALAVRAVYGLPTITAAALAMLPQAVAVAALLGLVLVIAVLHAVGVL